MMKVCFLSPTPPPVPPWVPSLGQSLPPRPSSLGSKCQASERAREHSGQAGGRPQLPRAKPAKPPRRGWRGYGVRDPGGGLRGIPESASRSNLPPLAPAPRALSGPSSPHTGATHGERLRWTGTADATGCAPHGSALLPAGCPPAEPLSSREGGAAAPSQAPAGGAPGVPGRGLGAPPTGSPLWTALR